MRLREIHIREFVEEWLFTESFYNDLEDSDEFQSYECEHLNCHHYSNIECTKCGRFFCDHHIWGVALDGGAQELCDECLMLMGYVINGKDIRESSFYSDLEDSDEFESYECDHPGCDRPNNIECTNCNEFFCDHHIRGVALKGGAQELCDRCLEEMGYVVDGLNSTYPRNW
jgi:hypothetical protein